MTPPAQFTDMLAASEIASLEEAAAASVATAPPIGQRATDAIASILRDEKHQFAPEVAAATYSRSFERPEPGLPAA